MASTVIPTPPKSPQGFTLAEVDGDDARVGRLLREAAHQPDVARPGLDAMAGSDLGEIPPSLGKRVSRDLVRFLIAFSIGVGASLVWQWYGNPHGTMWRNLSRWQWSPRLSCKPLPRKLRPLPSYSSSRRIWHS